MIALDDEDAAFLETGKRVGVLQHGRVRGEDHIDVEVLTVDLDGLGRRREVVGRRLALLLGTVFGIGLDVVSEQVEQGHGQVLTGRDGAPTSDGVEPSGDAVLGHEVRVLTTADRKLLDLGVALGDRLLVNLLLGSKGFVAEEVDGKIEEFLLPTIGKHVLDGSDEALGL